MHWWFADAVVFNVPCLPHRSSGGACIGVWCKGWYQFNKHPCLAWQHLDASESPTSRRRSTSRLSRRRTRSPFAPLAVVFCAGGFGMCPTTSSSQHLASECCGTKTTTAAHTIAAAQPAKAHTQEAHSGEAAFINPITEQTTASAAPDHARSTRTAAACAAAVACVAVCGEGDDEANTQPRQARTAAW